MKPIERLRSLLMAEKGFQRWEPAAGDLAEPLMTEELGELPPFGFVGTRLRWGSWTTIALVDADELDLSGMERFAARFFYLVHKQYSMTGGSFGTLCFVFDRPPTPAIVEHIRNLKRSVPGHKVWMAVWTIDLTTGRVIPHRWGPWGVYPGRAYIERAIRR